MLDQQAMKVIDNEYCLTNIQAIHSIQVTFSLEKYLIQSTSGANGQIYPSGKISINKGENQTFVMTPKDGYKVDSLKVDFQNKEVQENQYTINNVQQDHDVFVTFKKVYNISATVSGRGSIEPSGILTVDSGQAASFELLPDNLTKLLMITPWL
jgi:hypothetical protein